MLTLGDDVVNNVNVKTKDTNEIVKSFTINQTTPINNQLKEIREFIDYAKFCDKEEMGFALDYYLTLQTDKDEYGDFNIACNYYKNGTIYTFVNC